MSCCFGPICSELLKLDWYWAVGWINLRNHLQTRFLSKKSSYDLLTVVLNRSLAAFSHCSVGKLLGLMIFEVTLCLHVLQAAPLPAENGSAISIITQTNWAFIYSRNYHCRNVRGTLGSRAPSVNDFEVIGILIFDITNVCPKTVRYTCARFGK